MNNKAENKTKRLRRIISSAASAFAVFCLAGTSIYAGVPKTDIGLTYEITDDLAAGSAGSVDLAGGNIVLSGSIGQVAVSSAGTAGKEIESGYFSRYVSTPAALGAASVYGSSATVTGSGGITNPSGGGRGQVFTFDL